MTPPTGASGPNLTPTLPITTWLTQVPHDARYSRSVYHWDEARMASPRPSKGTDTTMR
jgi:hypothetical protein